MAALRRDAKQGRAMPQAMSGAWRGCGWRDRRRRTATPIQGIPRFPCDANRRARLHPFRIAWPHGLAGAAAGSPWDHQIEGGNDRVAPSCERSAHHPIHAWQKHLVHQPEPIGTLAHFVVGRRRWLPEIVVGVVMRDRKSIGQCAAEAADARAGRSRDVNAAAFHGAGLTFIALTACAGRARRRAPDGSVFPGGNPAC